MPRISAIPHEIVTLSAAFLFIFMGAGAQQQFLVPFFSEGTDWSPVARGLIPAAVYLSMTMSRVPAVWIVSKIGERPAMLLGGAAYVAFPLVVYFVPWYGMLVLGAMAWGIGAALMWVTSSIRVIDSVSAFHYGKTSGFFVGATHTGILFGYIILSRVADAASLRTVFLVASGISLVGWIIMMTLPAKHTERAIPHIAAVRSVTKLPNWRIVAALLGLAALGYGLMLVPLGEALVSTLGVSALALAAIYPVGRLIVSLTGGWLSDIVGRRAIIVTGFFLGGTGLAITAYHFGAGWAMALGIFSVGLLGGVAPAMGLAFVGDAADSRSRLIVHASLFMFNDLGVATAILFGQYLRGFFGGFEPMFGVFSAILLACGVWAMLSFKPTTTPNGVRT